MMKKFVDLISWYNNVFRDSSLYKNMNSTIENSPWHREKSVGIHTNMVFEEYLRITNSVWVKDDLLGGLATIFHDTGKPNAKVEKFSETRGKYFAFPGHEQISARLWEDYVTTHWKDFESILTPDDIFRVAWLIENHLPWDIKKPEKRQMLTKTVAFSFNDPTVFERVLWADQLGRVSDNPEKKLAEVGDWINQFENDLGATIIRGKDKPSDHNAPTCWVPIAPSGAGKTTLRTYINPETLIYSLDDLRTQLYGSDYTEAYRCSVEDSTFSNKAQKDFLEKIKSGKDVFIDNTNLSKKRRRFYVTEAHNRGYWIIAVLIPASLSQVVERQFTRGDKSVPEDAVYNQYMALQCPSIGEVDEIRVIGGNLPTSLD